MSGAPGDRTDPSGIVSFSRKPRVRQVSSIVDHVPPEIWRIIIEQGMATPHSSSHLTFSHHFSLTCRTFRGITIPYLFRSVTIRLMDDIGPSNLAAHWDNSSDYLAEKALDWDNLLQRLDFLATPRIAHVVKAICIDGRSMHYAAHGALSVRHRIVWDAIMERLPLFTCLQDLEFILVPLSTDDIYRIRSLHDLRTLGIDFYALGPLQIGETHHNLTTYHPMTSLTMLKCLLNTSFPFSPDDSEEGSDDTDSALVKGHDIPWWKHFFYPRSIASQSSGEPISGGNPIPLPSDIHHDYRFEALHSLIVSDAFMQSQEAFEILSYFPSLEILYLHSNDAHAYDHAQSAKLSPVLSIPAHIVPKLKILHGVWIHVKPFLPHHPSIRRLDVMTTFATKETADDVLNEIASFCGELTALRLHIGPVLDIFPIDILLTRFRGLEACDIQCADIDIQVLHQVSPHRLYQSHILNALISHRWRISSVMQICPQPWRCSLSKSGFAPSCHTSIGFHCRLSRTSSWRCYSKL